MIYIKQLKQQRSLCYVTRRYVFLYTVSITSVQKKSCTLCHDFFAVFNMAVARHFEFVKYANFNITHSLQTKSAYLYKISSRSVERLRRYRDFLISNMAAVRHFEFFKYLNFHFLHGYVSNGNNRTF